MRQKLKSKRRTKQQAPYQRVTLPPASQTVSPSRLADSKYRTVWQLSRELYEKIGKHVIVYEAGQPIRFVKEGSENLTDVGRRILETYNPRFQIAVAVIERGEAITYAVGLNSPIAKLRVKVKP